MSQLEKILEFNKRFVQNNDHMSYRSSKYPGKQIAILSCMDTRLSELLLAALGLKNGDAKIIKNAGGVINHPFGSVMRSLLVCIYELNVQEIIVIGHDDCGMQGLDANKMIEKMYQRNIAPEALNTIGYYGVDVQKWLKGFEDVETSIVETVQLIKKHPLIPEDIEIHGFVMNPSTGALRDIDSSREKTVEIK